MYNFLRNQNLTNRSRKINSTFFVITSFLVINFIFTQNIFAQDFIGSRGKTLQEILDSKTELNISGVGGVRPRSIEDILRDRVVGVSSDNVGTGNNFLRAGDESPAVAGLNKMLGLESEKDFFSIATRDKLSLIQRENGINDETGFLGPKTISLLKEKVPEDLVAEATEDVEVVISETLQRSGEGDTFVDSGAGQIYDQGGDENNLVLSKGDNPGLARFSSSGNLTKDKNGEEGDASVDEVGNAQENLFSDLKEKILGGIEDSAQTIDKMKEMAAKNMQKANDMLGNPLGLLQNPLTQNADANALGLIGKINSLNSQLLNPNLSSAQRESIITERNFYREQLQQTIDNGGVSDNTRQMARNQQRQEQQQERDTPTQPTEPTTPEVADNGGGINIPSVLARDGDNPVKSSDADIDKFIQQTGGDINKAKKIVEDSLGRYAQNDILSDQKSRNAYLGLQEVDRKLQERIDKAQPQNTQPEPTVTSPGSQVADSIKGEEIELPIEQRGLEVKEFRTYQWSCDEKGENCTQEMYTVIDNKIVLNGKEVKEGDVLRIVVQGLNTKRADTGEKVILPPDFKLYDPKQKKVLTNSVVDCAPPKKGKCNSGGEDSTSEVDPKKGDVIADKVPDYKGK